MKKTTVALVYINLFLVLLVMFFLLKGKEKVAYVDTGKLLSEYKEMQKVEKEIQIKNKEYQANLDTLQKEFEKEFKEYDRTVSNMSPKEKQLSQELLKTKQNQFLQYQEATKQKALKEETDKKQIVIKSINKTLEMYGKNHHYKIIFGTANGNIVYANKGLDITEDVLKYLNK